MKKFNFAKLVSASLIALLAVTALPATPALAAITSINNNIGTNTGKAAGTTLVITTTSAVAAGDDIIVSFAMDNAAGVVGVTDSAGNTYTSYADVTNVNGVRTLIFAAFKVNALANGGTITITHPNVTARAATASNFRGLAPTGAIDRSSTGTGTSAAPSSGATLATNQADELLVGAIGTEGPSGDTAGAWQNTFTNGPRAGTTGGAADSNITASMGYRIVNATGTYTASKNGVTSRDWAAAIATFRMDNSNYSITASAGAGGAINPSGVVSVPNHNNQTFTVTPGATFIVQDVSVDSISQGRSNSYTFTNVIADHAITASFNGGWSQPANNTGGGWTNEANAYASDNNYAVANGGGDQTEFYNFGLTIPACSTVQGIEVALEGNASANREVDIDLSWDGGGTFTGTAFTSAFVNGGTDATLLFGGPANTWGHVWNPLANEFTNNNFRVRLTGTGGGGVNGDVNLDQVQVKVYFTAVPCHTITATANAGGTITPPGAVQVIQGFNQSFDITPDPSFIVSNVSVDSIAQPGRPNTYTFTNVTASHTIIASFDGGWSQPANNTGGGWTNENEAYVSDNTYAVANDTADVTQFYDFGITAPVCTAVQGIEVAVEGNATATREVVVDLSWNAGGTFTGTTFTSAFVNGGTDTTYVFGGPNNTWGHTWNLAANELSNNNFRVRLDATGNAGVNGNVNIDQVQVKVYFAAAPCHTITATANAGGTINPAGAVQVTEGFNQSFDVTPAASYIVSSVSVDSVAQPGRPNTYTFTNVTASHTITASFDGGWSQPAQNSGGTWTNENEAYVSDNTYAVANDTADITQYYNFGIAAPACTAVQGIEVAVEGNATATREVVIDLSWNAGGAFTGTTFTSAFVNGGTDTTYVFGGPNNTWGHTWNLSANELSNNNFRVRLDATGGGGVNGDVNIDQLQVKVYLAAVPCHTITATANAGGTINPSGAVQVTEGFNQSFDITPAASHIVSSVSVDSVAQPGRPNAYTFTNVTASHTIIASFDGGWSRPANNSGGTWANEFDAYVSDNAHAVANDGADVTQFFDFGLTGLVPSGATIQGIEVALEGNATGSREVVIDLSWNAGGAFTGTTFTTSFADGGTDATFIFGGPANTWGHAWNPAANEFSNNNFRVRLDATGGAATGNVNIDQVQVKVYFTATSHTITATADAGGTITPSGAVVVFDTLNQAFDITPSTGYIANTISIDTVAQPGHPNAYTFLNNNADHAIHATFDGGWFQPSQNSNNSFNSGVGNAYTSNNSYASATGGGQGARYFGFGLAIPANAIINGIEVALEGNRTAGRTFNVELTWDNATFSNAIAQPTVFGAADSTVLYGSAATTAVWGAHLWTPAELNNNNFRVRVTASAGGGSINLDQIQVKVSYTLPNPVLTLVKAVNNNNGGLATINDWTLNAAGPVSISGTTGTPAVTAVTVTPGLYTLTETGGPAGYSLSLSCAGSADANPNDGLTLSAGETVTCTFANDDDFAAPAVTNVTSPDANGTYFPGALITIQITFDEPVFVTGAPQLALELGAVDGLANYTGGSGTATLTFTYTVVIGDITPDLDYVSAASLILNGGSIQDGALNNANLNLPAPGAANSLGGNKDIVIDADLLVVVNNIVNSNPDTGDGNISENESVPTTLSISQLIVKFNKNVYDDPADLVNFTDDVTNPANYRLLYSTTGTFNTLGCGVGGVALPLVAPDLPIPVTSVAYSNGGGSFVATLTLSTPLTTAGYYRLYICGTTSIVQANNPALALAGNGPAGTDFVRNFQLVAPTVAAGRGAPNSTDTTISARDIAALPATGFAPNRVTILPEQPADLAYADLGDLWIEIPALGVKEPIVGVPQTADGEWDVTWLANNIGWLNGTAFPSWQGNSVLTAHVTNADGLDGPFAKLSKLKYGDQIIVHLNGEKYIFEVRNSRLSRPYTTGFAFEHLEEQSYLTLITCQFYLPKSDTYFFRRVIRAVLVSAGSE